MGATILAYARLYVVDFASFLSSCRSREAFEEFLHEKCKLSGDDAFIEIFVFLLLSAALKSFLEIMGAYSTLDNLWLAVVAQVVPLLVFVVTQTAFMASIAGVAWRHVLVSHAYLFGVAFVLRGILLLGFGGNDAIRGATLLGIIVPVALFVSRESRRTVRGIGVVVSVVLVAYFAGAVENALRATAPGSSAAMGGAHGDFGLVTDYTHEAVSSLGSAWRENSDRLAAFDEPHQGSLGFGDEVVNRKYQDVWNLEVARDGPVVVRVESNAFDTYVRVRSTGGETIAENDDGGSLLGPTSNSRTAVSLKASETYEVVVTSFGEREVGPYVVTVIPVTLARALIDFAEALRPSALEDDFERDDWIDELTALDAEGASVLVLRRALLELEENMTLRSLHSNWMADISSQGTQNDLWRGDVGGAGAVHELISPLRTLEQFTLWEAVDGAWRARQADWIKELELLGG